jgi:hypothetical protein
MEIQGAECSFSVCRIISSRQGDVVLSIEVDADSDSLAGRLIGTVALGAIGGGAGLAGLLRSSCC